jgi:hypothetical protein
VGAILATLLLTQKGFADSQISNQLENIFYNNTIYIYLVSAMVLLLPSTILYIIGKKAYLEMMNSDEDEIDSAVKNKAAYLDSSMSILSVFTAVNFMQFGILYHKTTENPTTILALFMLGVLYTAILQVTIVKFIQKNDNRLKGDPTKASFSNDFLESMDEAEQLKVYKAGYKAFQLTKTITLVLIVSSIFMNILFGAGGFAIFISCVFMITHVLSFMYYEKRVVISS